MGQFQVDNAPRGNIVVGAEDDEMSICANCKGTGLVQRFSPGMDSSWTEPCPECQKEKKMKAKATPNCKHCDDTGLVAWEAGGQMTIDPCGCLLKKGISVLLKGGGLRLSFVVGGGVILKVSDNGGADGSPPDQLKFVVERDDLKKIAKAMKKARGIMKALKQK
jgi:endogenous inhibitor of DNA gyrase (YacG/DUF329 family)